MLRKWKRPLSNHPIASSGSSLFVRLMSSFLVIMLIPILLLGSLYFITGTRTLVTNLTDRGEIEISLAATFFKNMIEEYRHKAYQISTKPEIISLLQQDSIESKSFNTSYVYEQLFSIMKGDTYLASASIVSNSGKIRLSTHLFPPQYDVRYHSNDTNPFFDLSRASGQTASIITMRNRYVHSQNSLVFLNILRRVRDESQQVIGYVVVDIFIDALQSIAYDQAFSDLIIIDTDNFTASSVIHTERYGDFTKFPELQSLSFPLHASSHVIEGAIISVSPIANTPLVLAGITYTTIFQRSIEWIFISMLSVLTIGMIVAGFISYFFSRSIAKPVGTLACSMLQVEQGQLSKRTAESKILEINQLEHSFNIMIGQISSLIELTREEEEKLREAERKALEAQLNPHFLYNTLNTIKALAHLHEEREILSITIRLGKLLRNAIDHREALSTLQESFSLVEDYLAIQNIRFGSKLSYHLSLDPSIEGVKTPKLIIQPLVENALVHGLEPKLGNWEVSVTATVDHNLITITVIDNGVGIPEGVIPEQLEDLVHTEHIGLYNIYRRLMLHYGMEASLRISSHRGIGTCVIIAIPWVKEE